MTRGWVLRTPGFAPSARYAANACYCPALRATLVWGGTTDGNAAVADLKVYAWNSALAVGNWADIGCDAPIAGFGGGYALDPDRGVIVWCPGFNAGYLTTDYFEFDGAVWTTRAASPGGVWGSMSFYEGTGLSDANRGMYFYTGFGGSGTYRLNTATHTWVPVAPPADLANYGFSMAVDRLGQKLVAQGTVAAGETALFDGVTWSFIASGSGGALPDATTSQFFASTYNASDDLVYLKSDAHTYTWDRASPAWTELALTNEGITGCNHVAVVHDDAHGEIVTFGGIPVGSTSGSEHADTWVLADTSGPPPPPPGTYLVPEVLYDPVPGNVGLR